MPLAELAQGVADHVKRLALTPKPQTISSFYPTQSSDLPAVVISISDVRRPLPGVGRVSRSVRTGALRVEVSVDLADPSIVVAGEKVALLPTPDRRTLLLPHGAIVSKDGMFPPPPLSSNDLEVKLGAEVFVVVAVSPKTKAVLPNAAEGKLLFGAGLPESGKLLINYYIGTWETRVERLEGELRLEIVAGDASEADSLSRQLEALLVQDDIAQMPDFNRLVLTAWGAVEAVDEAHGRSCSRVLAYNFDYETEHQVIRTAGGTIRRVEVKSTFGAENGFSVTEEGKRT